MLLRTSLKRNVRERTIFTGHGDSDLMIEFTAKDRNRRLSVSGRDAPFYVGLFALRKVGPRSLAERLRLPCLPLQPAWPADRPTET